MIHNRFQTIFNIRYLNNVEEKPTKRNQFKYIQQSTSLFYNIHESKGKYLDV